MNLTPDITIGQLDSVVEILDKATDRASTIRLYAVGGLIDPKTAALGINETISDLIDQLNKVSK